MIDVRLLEDGGEEPQHSGLLIALWLDPNDAEVIKIPGGELPEDMHLTLCHCPGMADVVTDLELARLITDLEQVARETPPILGKISGMGRFSAHDEDDLDVLYASYDSADLMSLRSRVSASLRSANIKISSKHGFQPHITLAYVEQDLDTNLRMPAQHLRLDRLVLAVGNRTLEFPLTGQRDYMPGAPMPLYESSGVMGTKSDDVSILDAELPILEAESTDATGSKWQVLLIKEGLSGNGVYYSEDVLKAAAPLFEGVRAYADHPTKDEMKNRPERSIRDVVGWYDGVAWSDEHRGLTANLHIVESADWLKGAFRSAWSGGNPTLLGFSINAGGTKSGRRRNGGILLEAITSVRSTDVVTTPGAGGRLLNVLESMRSEDNVEVNGQAASQDPPVDINSIKSELLTEVKAILVEALRPQAPAQEVTLEEAAGDAVTRELTDLRNTMAEFTKAQRVVAIGARVDAAGLPAKVAGQLKTRLLEANGRRAVDDAEVDGEIEFARTLLRESGVAGTVALGNMKAGDAPVDKHIKGLMGWFKGEAVDGVQPIRDLRESYSTFYGQNYLDVDPYQMFADFSKKYDSGRDHVRLQESLGTSDWGQVFADVFYLQMIAAYRESPDYDKWRMFVSDIESVPDFRTRHWTRIGGYNDFGSVAERETYPTITSPGDEELTYAVQKYGGLDDISMEMILGDRLNVVRRLPQLMAYAAIRTLYKFVMDLITTSNPTMDYDSVALYHAGSHGNSGTAALSITALNNIVIAMRSQTAFGQSQEILGTRNKPKYIIIPNELEGRAQRILNPSDAFQTNVTDAGADTTLDPQRFKNSEIEYHVYDQLTNAADWWAVADPKMVPTMVMGFLNGRQEPELFTQDTPNVGSVFTADKITYKLRFVFGGDVIEHRSFYYNDV